MDRLVDIGSVVVDGLVVVIIRKTRSPPLGRGPGMDQLQNAGTSIWLLLVLPSAYLASKDPAAKSNSDEDRV